MQPTLIDLAQRLRDEPDRWHSHRGESGLVWAIRPARLDLVAVVHETCADTGRGGWRGYAVPWRALATGVRETDGPWVIMDDERGLIEDLGPCARSADACRRKLLGKLRKNLIAVAGCTADMLSARSMGGAPETA